MKLELRTRGVDNDSELRNVVDRKLRFALARFGTVVERVHVSITDQNGPKGGDDKLCRLRLVTSVGEPIVIDEVDAVAERALDTAVDRAARTLARMLGRGRRSRAPSNGSGSTQRSP